MTLKEGMVSQILVTLKEDEDIFDVSWNKTVRYRGTTQRIKNVKKLWILQSVQTGCLHGPLHGSGSWKKPGCRAFWKSARRRFAGMLNRVGLQRLQHYLASRALAGLGPRRHNNKNSSPPASTASSVWLRPAGRARLGRWTETSVHVHVYRYITGIPVVLYKH